MCNCFGGFNTRKMAKLKWKFSLFYRLNIRLITYYFMLNIGHFLLLNIKQKIRLKYFVMRNYFGIVIKKLTEVSFFIGWKILETSRRLKCFNFVCFFPSKCRIRTLATKVTICSSLFVHWLNKVKHTGNAVWT